MKFGFVAKHRGSWPVLMLCEALGVSRKKLKKLKGTEAVKWP